MLARSSGYDINKVTSTTGVLKVKIAATVVCARVREKAAQILRLRDVKKGKEGIATDNRIGHLFGKRSETSFTSNWELLMGQSEVQNYLRSSSDSVSLMRHGGEYRFAGGVVDSGETLKEAASRELSEEFCCDVPLDAKLRLFAVRQTRPVQNTSFIMCNFLCLESENPWLQKLDVDRVNLDLARRKSAFWELLAADKYWCMSREEKMSLCPEVHNVQWLDMRSAVAHAFTSMNSELTFVNDFQQREFQRLAITRRDPLFITMSVMTELESYPSVESVVNSTDALDAGVELRRAQWLSDGMPAARVQEIMEEREKLRKQGLLASIKTAEELSREKASRLLSVRVSHL